MKFTKNIPNFGRTKPAKAIRMGTDIRMKTWFTGFFLLFFYFNSLSQNIWEGYEHLFLPVRNYVAYRTIDQITIDGRLTEASWNKAEWTGDFSDIEGAQKLRPLFPTRVKMLWDDQAIYIVAEITEPHIWAYYTTHDQIVYHENDFEVFIDPDQDSQNYFEFELNAANTLFDLFMTRPYRSGGIPLINWNSPNFQSAVTIDGTINNAGDADQKWILEMAIPFEDLRLGVFSRIPEDGQTWKINFSRVNWQTQLEDGKYVRKKDDKTGRQLSEYNWVWNPTGEINMHVPERWGFLQFSKNPVSDAKAEFRIPETEQIKKYLWLIFYKQHKYRQAFGKFADRAVDLSISEKIGTLALTLQATNHQFWAVLKSESGEEWAINEHGEIRKIEIKR